MDASDRVSRHARRGGVEWIGGDQTHTEQDQRARAANMQIMFKLAQNPRTPLANSMNILTRLQTKDLLAMSKNRNISEAIRKQSVRLASMRVGRK